MSERLTIPTSFSAFITGTRRMRCLTKSLAASATGAVAAMVIGFLLMMSATVLPFLSITSNSETTPASLPLLSRTGKPVMRCRVRIAVSSSMVADWEIFRTSLDMMSFTWTTNE